MKKKIVLIEDDNFYINEFVAEVGEKFSVTAFKSPNDFVDKNPNVSDISAVFLDFDFGYFSEKDNQIAEFLRTHKNFKGKIIIWTLLEEFDEETRQYLDSFCDEIWTKRDLSLKNVERLFLKPTKT